MTDFNHDYLRRLNERPKHALYIIASAMFLGAVASAMVLAILFWGLML